MWCLCLLMFRLWIHLNSSVITLKMMPWHCSNMYQHPHISVFMDTSTNGVVSNGLTSLSSNCEFLHEGFEKKAIEQRHTNLYAGSEYVDNTCVI